MVPVVSEVSRKGCDDMVYLVVRGLNGYLILMGSLDLW